MKIITAEQIKKADLMTINKENITSWQLMERASEKVCSWIAENLKTTEKFCVFAGVGNNGGDGLAVARMLVKAGKQVAVFIVHFGSNPSPDFLKNRSLLHEMDVKTTDITDQNMSFSIEDTENTVIIDAIFGIGLSNRGVSSWVQAVFEKINGLGAYILSIDIPSGVYLDKIPSEGTVFVRPTHVLTFQVPKLVFFLPQIGKYIPSWEVLDIGLDPEFIENTPSEYEIITKESVKRLYQPRNRFTHKGIYGHALLVGGSYGKMGAVVLSGESVLKAGAGLLTVLIPKCGYIILQTALPEAMVITSKGKKHITEAVVPFTPSVVGIGIGLGTHIKTKEAVFQLFANLPNTPFVIDADAINLLAMFPEGLNLLPPKTILTPHPKELERLIGKWVDDFQKLEKAKKFALEHNLILVLKDAYTFITNGISFWINTTGNPRMATAGSGDVLTGIITGLVAQGYEPLEACISGVYLHGMLGDQAILKQTPFPYFTARSFWR